VRERKRIRRHNNMRLSCQLRCHGHGHRRKWQRCCSARKGRLRRSATAWLAEQMAMEASKKRPKHGQENQSSKAQWNGNENLTAPTKKASPAEGQRGGIERTTMPSLNTKRKIEQTTAEPAATRNAN